MRAKVDSLVAAGKHQEARSAADNAKNFALIAAIIGFIGSAVLGVFNVLLVCSEEF